MKIRIHKFSSDLKTTFVEWRRDGAVRLAAALAFYTAISLTPLVIIVVTTLGFVVGDEAARGQLARDLSIIMSDEAAHFVEDVIENSDRPKIGGITGIVSFLVLIWGATNVFAQLQFALNRIWNVDRELNGGVSGIVIARFFSFGMVLGIVFVLLVSLVVSTLITSIVHAQSESLPGPDALWLILNFCVGFIVITLLFAGLFKYVPQVHVRWRDVWLGAALTALLFSVGKFGLGVYLGSRETSYAAGGSLLALLLWTYYSAQIMFFGAEFTQVVARRDEPRTS